MRRLIAGLVVSGLVLVACSSESDSDSDASIDFTESTTHAVATFTATGGAVDDGVICAEGEAGLVGESDTATGGTRDYEFTCTDGSGGFTATVTIEDWAAYEQQVVAYVESGELWEDEATWTIVSATGSYESLEGSGSRGFQVGEAGVAPWEGGAVRLVFVGDFSS